MRKFSQIEKFEYLVKYEDNVIKKLSDRSKIILNNHFIGSFCISGNCDNCVFFKTFGEVCPKDFEYFNEQDWDEFLEKYPEYKIVI